MGMWGLSWGLKWGVGEGEGRGVLLTCIPGYGREETAPSEHLHLKTLSQCYQKFG